MLKLRIEARHAELIQLALNDREAGDDHAIYSRIMRALKGRRPDGTYANIRPATETRWSDGRMVTVTLPGFPQRSWAYKDGESESVEVGLTEDQASKVETALREIAKKRTPSRQDGSGGVPYISAAQGDTYDDLMSAIIPAWKKGSASSPPEALWWDSPAAREIADGKAKEG